MSVNFILPFLSLLAGAFLSIVITNKNALSFIFACAALFSFSYSLYLYNLFRLNPSLELFYNFGGFNREIGIEYSLTSFKSWILTGLTALILIFSIFFIGFSLKYERPFQLNFIFTLVQVLCASSIAVLFTNDIFNFYIFFELISICSYILISLGGRGAPFAALNYLIMGMIASGLIVIGIGLLYFLTGFLNISLIAAKLKEGVDFNLLIPFILILTGFMVKLSIFPFSFWPGLIYKTSPLSILPLYGALVNAITYYGFYLFFSKFFLPLEAAFPFLKTTLLILTGIGVLCFSIFSIMENNIRTIFAYSTIVQIAYAFFGIFIMQAKMTALSFLHLFFNSFSKIGLFIILFELYNRNRISLDNSILNGLSHTNKALAFYIIFFLAGLIGLPPLFGFFTKAGLIIGAFSSENYSFAIILVLGSLLNFIYFFKLAVSIFFRCPTEKAFKMSRGSHIALAATMAMLIIVTIFFNNLLEFSTNTLVDIYNFYAV